MSLFDSIKYPISNPPTQAQLDQVPIEFITKWLDIIPHHNNLSNIEIYNKLREIILEKT